MLQVLMFTFNTLKITLQADMLEQIRQGVVKKHTAKKRLQSANGHLRPIWAIGVKSFKQLL
jgi:hypothetical protein